MGSNDVGAQLRSTREARGLTLETMAHRTRVQPRILTAIEENDLRSIPPKPFGRGFVRAYAREVGLDPERAVHDYFGQFPSATPEPAPKRTDYEPPQGSSWVVPATGIAVLVMLIAWGLRGGDAGTEVAATSDAIGTTGSSAAVAAAREASSAAAAAPTPAPTPAPASTPPAPSAAPRATPGEVNVVLTVNAPTWITASTDGKRAIYRVLQPGSREQLTAAKEISVLTGNAGGVELTINGRSAGPMGKSGQVRSVRINPTNAASVGQR
jgi:cytoskeleton protein RodZ